MNIETTYTPSPAMAGYVDKDGALAAATGAGTLPPPDAPLSIRESANTMSAEAAKRLDAVDEADALKPDRLDALIKSVLDFPPPAMPDLT